MNIMQPAKLPFLEFLGWQIADVYRLNQLEMLTSYERGWRYRHIANLSASELAFIQQLALNRKSWLSSEFMNFEIDRHQLIYRILAGLNCEFLSECRAYFGGGTLISLDLGEYRTSNDVDFICEVGSDYRKLRNTISDRTPQILLQDNSDLEIERFTADQYGIRMAIVVDDIPIKTEIIAEARFDLEPPRQPSWSPVECLSITDCFTSKLLANADRYTDRSVHSRDLIDLAFLRTERPIPPLAIEKAEAAYRVIPPLSAALTKFQQDVDLRFHCYENLTITKAFRSKLIDGIDLLAGDLGLDKTTRNISESGDEIFPFI
ncbi:nucleotidyl transferase AbiEii/AbiGii toxin family protein [Chamaesiphon sp. VAR_48_metabat_403]|uniref:nucleotidyl transferase AbiEii/AbiGii toxin family protein n=1 Tax=Chamaesiphon sp. VAR_48_metabat_403 TaxID=2964700 RepID=UPI00286D8403|nr:nucleotidyl transferase AbiEii/AbiGii toxin family protein [Chamaesiphon sp. VAR_48_metabat_403]